MMILSRKKNEGLVINNNITVTVVEIREDKVRLGLVCPRDVPVHRQEVYDAIHGRPTDSFPTAPAEPPPVPRPVAPPTVQLAERQGIWLDRLAAALKARTGMVVDRSVLVQAILDAAMQERGDAGDEIRRT